MTHPVTQCHTALPRPTLIVWRLVFPIFHYFPFLKRRSLALFVSNHAESSTRRTTTDASEVRTDSVTSYGGHATQILWKSTERLGCATSVCTAGEAVYLVCQYDPP